MPTNPTPSSAAVNPSSQGEPVAWDDAVKSFVDMLRPVQQIFHSDGTVQASWHVEGRMLFSLDFTEALKILETAHPSPSREALEKALEPFATFGIDESGNNIRDGLMRDRICDWFGPDDFERARAARSPTDGRSSAGQSDKLSNETVARALKAFQEAANSMVMCQRCNGTGYHHGFGEHGHDPDWCVVCGGCQSVAEFDDEGAMRKALEAVGACSIPVESLPTRQLVEFFKWAMREGPWNGSDIDGDSVQDKAESLGLIVKTKFDPEKHDGPDWAFSPGDYYYEFAPALRCPAACEPESSAVASTERQA